MGLGTVLLGGRTGCRPLWPRGLLDRVESDIRRGLWWAGSSWGAGAGGWRVLSRLLGGGAVFWQGGAGSWGATARAELDPVAIAQWVFAGCSLLT